MAINNSSFDNREPYLTLNEAVVVSGVFPSFQDGDSGSTPLASIRTFAFALTPGGHLAAAGSIQSIAQNSALFSLLGTEYGGDGRTTFAIPDLRGRTSIGVDSLHPVGTAAGSANTTLTRLQIPTSRGGGGQPVDNTQPELAITYGIRVEGVFPSSSNSGAPGDLIGEIVQFAGNFTPNNGGAYLPADGRILNISAYPTLFALLGTTYGGNGQNTFALPDLRGRDIVGSGTLTGDGTPYTLGQTVGQSQVALINANLPATVGGQTTPFTNEQPGLVLTYAVATSGIFPSQDNGGGSPDGMPYLGEVRAFALQPNQLPDGWHVTDGAILAIAEYNALYSLIGNIYGGDGQTNFALPDLQGRVVLGASGSQSSSLGLSGGSRLVTLSDAQTPNFIAPVNTVPGGVTADLSDTVTFSSAQSTQISVQDGDNTDLSVTLDVAHGALTIADSTGLIVAGNGSGHLVLTGAATTLNTRLDGLVYRSTPGYSGQEALTVTTTDSQLTDTDTVAITVASVNDAPVNTVPAALSYGASAVGGVTGISIADMDALAGTLTTTLAVQFGTLTIATVPNGALIAGSGTASVTLTGTLAKINATLSALSSVTYQGSAGKNDTLTVTTNDTGNTGAGGPLTDTDVVSLTVAPAPTYTITASADVSEGNPPGPGGVITYTVTRSGDTSLSGSVDVTLTGNASASSDYSLASGTGTYTPTGTSSGTLAFAANAMSATFTVTATPDTLFEGSEGVIATISNAQGQTGGTIGGASFASANLTNDDAAPNGGGGGGAPPPLVPTPNDDTLSGTDGPDAVALLAGRDTYHGNGGDDLIYGGTGPSDPTDAGDTLYGDAGADTIFGNAGDDTIYGGTGPSDPTDAGDIISAGLGNDVVFGNGGDDLIFGNEGSDTVSGGRGRDTIYGGNGPADPNDGADLLFGGEDGDLIFGNGGDDIIYGGTGPTDPTDGGDIVYAGFGNDTIFGNGGADRLFGNEGNDILIGGVGDDVMTGGPGADRFYFAPGDGRDTVTDFSLAEGDRLALSGQSFTASAVQGGTELALSGGGVVVLDGIDLLTFQANQASVFA